jgi:hypothetical protein
MVGIPHILLSNIVPVLSGVLSKCDPNLNICLPLCRFNVDSMMKGLLMAMDNAPTRIKSLSTPVWPALNLFKKSKYLLESILNVKSFNLFDM